MTLGVRAKLFLVSLGIIVVSVLALDAYLRSAFDEALTERIKDDLLVRLGLLEREASASTIDLDDTAAWDALADDLGRRAHARATFIRVDGRVIGDSEVLAADLAEVENHATRSEVAEALVGASGFHTRRSATVNRRMLYVAVPFFRDAKLIGVARLAMPLDEIDVAVIRVRRILAVGFLLALGVAVLMSTGAAHFMSRVVRRLTEAARRMAAGDLSVRTRVGGRDELGELGRTLDQLADGLSSSLGELRAERDLLGRILEGMQEGVLVLDAERRVLLVNPALRSMLLLGADVIGKSPIEVVRNADLQSIIDRALSGDAAATGEIEVGGLKPRQLLVHAAALSGEPRGLMAVFVDVTEMRRLESLRKDFVANVSHELRTPVASVLSAAETVRGSAHGDPAATAGFLEMIERNARRLHDLVEDLLDLSRIESREIKLNLEALPVAAFCRQVIALVAERAAARRIVLRVDLPATVPAVRADRRAFEQTLVNLLENAIKYCPVGAEVVLRAAPVGRLLRLQVVDTGPGIEPRHLPRLFERFYRVDPGRSRDMGGTGLGLSIVKHLVEAMGGAVDVESTVGKGSTFSFTVPIAAPAAQPPT